MSPKDIAQTTRASDRNLLFGVLAVQLKQITPSQLVEAAALWATDPDQSLGERLIQAGALSLVDRDLIDSFVDRAIAAHDNDATKTLAVFGGDDEIYHSFRGTVVRSPEGWKVQQPQLADPSAETRLSESRPTEVRQPLVREAAGRYRDKGEHGRGGMGRVLLVDDQELGREIVMKVLLDDAASKTSAGPRSGARHSESKRARFLQEAQITGQLEHPSIVPVYELGRRDDGVPYYTMKYVRGKTLSQALKGCNHLGERLKLLQHYVDLCQAIAYAHSRGVIHRDLKPSNVMVGEFGETVVIDWGLAKVKGRRDLHAARLEEGLRSVQLGDISASDRTSPGEIMGTPVYMPPEQARGDIESIDERSDVYALGVILYQIITGQKPFRGLTPEKVVEKVINEDPEPIEKAEPESPKELVAICQRAMLKNPSGRYPGAKELADEIERFLSGAIVQAYEYRPAEYLAKFVRRHRPLVTTAAGALLAIIALSGWYVSNIVTTNRELAIARDRESGLRQSAEREAYHSAMVLAQSHINNHEPVAARQVLDEAPEPWRNWEWGYLHRVSDQSLITLAGYAGPLLTAAFSPNGAFIASGSADGTVRLWDAESGTEQNALLGHGVKVLGAYFSDDGSRFTTISVDGAIKVWDVATGSEIRALGEVQPDVRAVAYSPANELIATGSLSGLATVIPIGDSGEQAAFEADAASLWSVAFDAEGRRLAAGGDSGEVTIWEIASKSLLHRIGAHESTIRVVAFSADGSKLVSGSDDSTAAIWDAQSGALLHRLRGHEEPITDAMFVPDGQRVISASIDKTARVWDASNGAELQLLRGHSQAITTLTVSEDGNRLLTSSVDKTVKGWDLQTGTDLLTLTGHGAEVNGAVFSPDGSRVLTISNDETAKLWDARTGSAQVILAGHDHIVTEAAFSADGTRIATAAWDKKARVFQASNGNLLRTLEGHEDFVDCVGFSPDGQQVVTGSWDKTARIWDIESSAELERLSGHEDIVESVTFSPDGGRILTASPDKTARLWDVNTGESIRIFSGHTTGLLSAVFDASGSRIATTSLDRTAKVWNAETGEEQLTLSGHERAVTSVAFSADGTLIATTSTDGAARLWNAATGKPLHVLTGHQEGVWGAAFTIDSARVATASVDGTVRMWDVATGAPLLTLSGHGDGVQSVAFDRSGGKLVTASLDRTARVWEAGPWDRRAWDVEEERSRLIRLARRETPQLTNHMFGFDRAGILDRLDTLAGTVESAVESGAIEVIDRQGLLIVAPDSLSGFPELGFREGDLLFRVNNINVASLEDMSRALQLISSRITSQLDRPHTMRFDIVNFLQRRLVRMQFPQLVERELTVPRPLAVGILERGIANSKMNRQRWAAERGPRESDVLILTDLAFYQQVGLEAQDRMLEFVGTPISGLDSVIEAMEKALTGLQDGTFDEGHVIFARDRLDQLIRVTFKVQ